VILVDDPAYTDIIPTVNEDSVAKCQANIYRIEGGRGLSKGPCIFRLQHLAAGNQCLNENLGINKKNTPLPKKREFSRARPLM
jgi:hypothetical protein